MRFSKPLLIACLLSLLPTVASANETKMKSAGLFASGIGVAFLGVATVPWGVGFIAMSNTGSGGSSGPNLTGPGVAMIGLGAAAIAGGIIMMAVGAKRVPVTVGATGFQLAF